MATQQRTVDFILDQMGDAGAVSAKRMFGEYGVFLDGKMFALICDDRLFLKPTPAGRELLGAVTEAPPYPGAKPCLLIPEEDWDDRERLAALARVTADGLEAPRKKTKARS
ncbi:TfoX/Sxy family protein [Mesoterricola silvestris]|uniref:Competence protein TfoX n=1 Tax=Mesoterricola silvestris TaxID=2927979 RepID=A0AA48GNU2_9BACT|nr:TfoX/Sxy family protein [Mesoterricola silvestris]BDU72955.1 competence protein TfoX [Mesoterricola silvestris]